MCVSRISSWDYSLLPKDETFTMALGEQQRDGVLLPPDLSTSTFPVLETGGLGGIRPGLDCCVSCFGSRPGAGENRI